MGVALESHIRRVCDKIALSAFHALCGGGDPKNIALHHEIYTNKDALSGNIKLDHIDWHDGGVIRQGRKTSAGQFSYALGMVNQLLPVAAFVFQRSLMVVSYFAHGAVGEWLLNNDGKHDWRRPMTTRPRLPSAIILSPPKRIIRPVFFGV